jgi:hypothetical protein
MGDFYASENDLGNRAIDFVNAYSDAQAGNPVAIQYINLVGQNTFLFLTTAGLGNIAVAADEIAAAESGGGLGRSLGRFFYDNRAFKTISREYWNVNGPAEGSSLHHWLFSQSATWVPQGIRNAGFNLMELSPIIDTPFGGLNQWMGMSRSGWAPVADWGIRLGVPAAVGSGAYGGTQIGNCIFGNSDPNH